MNTKDNIYLVVESNNNDMSINLKPICACLNYNDARSYLNNNRKIIGPIPIFDKYIMSKDEITKNPFLEQLKTNPFR